MSRPGQASGAHRAAGLTRLVGVALLSVLAVTACREKSTVGPPQTLPSQTVEDLVLHESSSGKRLYTLEAEKAYVYDADQRIEVTSPHVAFYDEAGKVHSRLVADAGTIYSKTEDLVARGHVEVRTEDSTMLATDSLSWANSRRVVRTDAPVEISTPRGRVNGRGLVSDAGLTKIEILSEVTGRSDYDFQTGK